MALRQVGLRGLRASLLIAAVALGLPGGAVSALTSDALSARAEAPPAQVAPAGARVIGRRSVGPRLGRLVRWAHRHAERVRTRPKPVVR